MDWHLLVVWQTFERVNLIHELDQLRDVCALLLRREAVRG